MSPAIAVKKFLGLDTIKQSACWQLLKEDERDLLGAITQGSQRLNNPPGQVANVELLINSDKNSICPDCWRRIETSLKFREEPVAEGLVRIINADSLNNHILNFDEYLKLALDPACTGYPTAVGQKHEICNLQLVADQIKATGELFWTFDTHQLQKLIDAGTNWSSDSECLKISGFHPPLDSTTEIALSDISRNILIYEYINIFLYTALRNEGFKEIEHVPKNHFFILPVKINELNCEIMVFLRETDTIDNRTGLKTRKYVYAISKADLSELQTNLDEYKSLQIQNYNGQTLLETEALKSLLPDLTEQAVEIILEKINSELKRIDYVRLSDPFLLRIPTDNWRLFGYKNLSEAVDDNFSQMANQPNYPTHVGLSFRIVKMPSAKKEDCNFLDPDFQIVFTENQTEIKRKITLLKPYELLDFSQVTSAISVKKLHKYPKAESDSSVITDYKECRLLAENADKAIELLAMLREGKSEILKRTLTIAFDQDKELQAEVEKLFGFDSSGKQISCESLEFSDSPYINNNWSNTSEINQPRGYRFRIAGYAQNSDHICITGNGFHRLVKVSGAYFEVLLPSPCTDSEITITPIKGLKRGRSIVKQIKAYSDPVRVKEMEALIASAFCSMPAPTESIGRNFLTTVIQNMPDPAGWEHAELERQNPVSETTIWMTDKYALEDYIWDLTDGFEMQLEDFDSKRARPGDVYDNNGLISIARKDPKSSKMLMTFDTNQLKTLIAAGVNKVDDGYNFGLLGFHQNLHYETEMLLTDFSHKDMHGNKLVHSMLMSKIIEDERRQGITEMAGIPKDYVFKLPIKWRDIDRLVKVFVREAYFGNVKRYVYAMHIEDYKELEAEVSKHPIQTLKAYTDEVLISDNNLAEYLPKASTKIIDQALNKIRFELNHICLYKGYLLHLDEEFSVSIPTDYWQFFYPTFDDAQEDKFMKMLNFPEYPTHVDFKFKFVINTSENQECKYRCAQNESIQIVFAEKPAAIANKIPWLYSPLISTRYRVVSSQSEQELKLELEILKEDIHNSAKYFDDIPPNAKNQTKPPAKWKTEIGTASKDYDGNLFLILKNNKRIPLFRRSKMSGGIQRLVPAVLSEDLPEIITSIKKIRQ